jgi:hypothetical protein
MIPCGEKNLLNGMKKICNMEKPIKIQLSGLYGEMDHPS